MGFLDRLKRTEATDKTTFTVTARATTRLDQDGNVVADGGGDASGEGQQAALEQLDHLANELLAAAGKAGGVGGANMTVSSRILVDGQPVSPDDPRAHEAMTQAAAKLRARGLDDLADQLEQRMAAAPSAPPEAPEASPLASAPHAAAAPRQAVPAPVDVSGAGAPEDPAAGDAVTGEAPADDVAGTDPGDAPSAPEAPSPPSPPF